MEHFLLFSIVSTAITLLSIFAASSAHTKTNEAATLGVAGEEEEEKDLEVKETAAKFARPSSPNQLGYLPQKRLAVRTQSQSVKIFSLQTARSRRLSMV